MHSKRIKISPHASSPTPDISSIARPTLATVLCIPELLELVIAYLTLQERGRLLLTNRHMSTELTPFLWRDIPHEAANRLQDTFDLEKYVHLIQSIDFSKATLAPIINFSEATLNSKSIQKSNDDLIWASGMIHRLKTSDRPPNHQQPQQRYGLRRLCFLRTRSYLGSINLKKTWPFSENDLEGPVISRGEVANFRQYCRILRTSPRLTHLAVPSNILLRKHDKYQRLFLSMLSKDNLPYLQSLIVASKDSYCSEPISLNIGLMLLCRALELKDLAELRCGFEILSSKASGEITAEKEEKYQEGRAMAFQNCLTTLQTREPDRAPRRLKTLQLPSTLWPLEFLIPFFTNCVSGIERLAVPWLSRFNDVESIGRLVNAIRSSCPSIQHIEAVMALRLTDQCDISLSIEALVQAATGGHGLVSFETYEVSWKETCFNPLLFQQATLERVISEDRFHHGDANVIKIMETCPNLKVVHAPWFEDQDLGHKMVSGSFPWKCKGLTTLCITMGEPDSTTAAKSAYYKALGQLTRLQNLTLGYSLKLVLLRHPSYTDLLLESRHADGLQGGYLGLLAGLKELRRLCLMQDFWTCLTMTEIKFMAEKWPRLESISFITEDVEWLKKYLEVIACWKELKVLRPGIEYRVMNSAFVGRV